MGFFFPLIPIHHSTSENPTNSSPSKIPDNEISDLASWFSDLESIKSYNFKASTVLTALLVVGTVSIIAGYLFKSPSKSSQTLSQAPISSSFSASPLPDPFPYQFKISSSQLFLELAKNTQSPSYLNVDEIHFKKFPCPCHTAVSSQPEKRWHANYLGDRINPHTSITEQPEIRKDFIAAQSPLLMTNLWETAFDKCSLIVDLLNERDMGILRGKGVDKYYPGPNHRNKVIGSLIVSPNNNKALKELPDTQCYDYELIPLAEHIDLRTISRIHYNNWVNYDVTLLRVNELIKLVDIINEYKDKSKDHSTVILLCLNGNSKSAILATLWYINEQIKEQKISNEESFDDALRKLIPTLRMQRGEIFIENDQQLELLRQCGYHLLKSKCLNKI